MQQGNRQEELEVSPYCLKATTYLLAVPEPSRDESHEWSAATVLPVEHESSRYPHVESQERTIRNRMDESRPAGQTKWQEGTTQAVAAGTGIAGRVQGLCLVCRDGQEGQCVTGAELGKGCKE